MDFLDKIGYKPPQKKEEKKSFKSFCSAPTKRPQHLEDKYDATKRPKPDEPKIEPASHYETTVHPYGVPSLGDHSYRSQGSSQRYGQRLQHPYEQPADPFERKSREAQRQHQEHQSSQQQFGQIGPSYGRRDDSRASHEHSQEGDCGYRDDRRENCGGDRRGYQRNERRGGDSHDYRDGNENRGDNHQRYASNDDQRDDRGRDFRSEGGRGGFNNREGGRGRFGGRGDGGFGNLSFREECERLEGVRASQSGSPTLEMEAQMNALSILSNCKQVHRYHVTMIKKTNNKERDLTVTPKNDAAAIQKEQFVFAIVYKLLDKFSDHFGSDKYAIVYDGGPTLYARDRFAKKEAVWSFTMEQVKELFRDPKRSEEKSYVESYLAKFVTFEVTVKETLPALDLSTCAMTASNREAQKFYDILLSATVKEGNFLNYGLKTFDKLSRADSIGMAKEVKTGLEKTTRVIGENEDAKLVFQVSTKATAFHKSESMLDYIGELLGNKDTRDHGQIVNELERNPRAINKVSNELKNLHVRAIHTNRCFIVKRIDSKSTPRSVKFFNEKINKEISVMDYFQSQYDYYLKYENCPMAVEKLANRETFYPLEVLEIMPGSRIGTNRLGNLAEEVHKRSRLLPHEQKSNTMRELEKMQLIHKDNPYLKAFNVKLDRDFIRVMAVVLMPPTKIGGGNQVAGEGSKARVNTFFEPAHVSNDRGVVVTIVDRCMSERDASIFWDTLKQAGTRKGMVLPNKCRVEEFYTEDSMERFFEEMRKKFKPAIMFFITRDKRDSIHNTVKYWEARLGIQTEHVSQETVRKFCQNRGAAATIENVLRKMNPKLGGINDALRAPDNDKSTQNYFTDRWFMGLELSHPAAQCDFDRQNAVAGDQPTVVGVAYSVGRPERLSGRFYFQEPRIHNIKRIGRYAQDALIRYNKKGLKLPSQFIVFRQGASDGDLPVVEREIAELRESCAQMGYNPRLIFFLSICRSGSIVMPKSLPNPGQRVRARDVNVPSGTVLQQTNATGRYPEFEIKSQESNIGTSKMTRVIIMANDPNAQLRELEKVMHWCCFAHQPSTMPTSKPHVLYAANELAKRGTNYFIYDKSTYQGSMDTMNMTSGASDKLNMKLGEENDDYYVRKDAEAVCALENHFWA